MFFLPSDVIAVCSELDLILRNRSASAGTRARAYVRVACWHTRANTYRKNGRGRAREEERRRARREHETSGADWMTEWHSADVPSDVSRVTPSLLSVYILKLRHWARATHCILSTNHFFRLPFLPWPIPERDTTRQRVPLSSLFHRNPIADRSVRSFRFMRSVRRSTYFHLCIKNRTRYFSRFESPSLSLRSGLRRLCTLTKHFDSIRSIVVGRTSPDARWFHWENSTQVSTILRLGFYEIGKFISITTIRC